MSHRLGILFATLGLLATVLTAPPAAAAAEPTVLKRVEIGRSVQGRPILAYQLGTRSRKATTVVLIATMHGDEAAPRQILQQLVKGEPVRRINLWVVPTYNPDGLAAGRRQNARGVDLNRNYPHHWVDLDGATESGSGPASEPETRAMMDFLRRVRPDHILSFHQPLHGVDTDTKDRRFARRVAAKLQLPKKTFDCGGVCHGTMTAWYNRRFRGNALTVEYGARPSGRHLRRVAPDQVLEIFRAWRGYRTVEESPNRG